MRQTQNTLSNTLALDEVLTRLAASETVDGLALFGSRSSNLGNPISDYDVLILVTNPPVGIFQMLTHIDGRMADVVFVETKTAEGVLTTHDPASATAAEGLFLLKMQKAQIVYDASGRLHRVQQKVKRDVESGGWPPPSTYSAVYAAWFWQNHGLYHMKRMVGSDDPVYLTAVDLMMLSGLSGVCRAYYCVRHLPWEGEKGAIRYLQECDPDYLALLRECVAAVERVHKLNLYEQLVKQALAPVGNVWAPGLTAVYLDDPSQRAAQLDTALAFWEALLSGTSPEGLSSKG